MFKSSGNLAWLWLRVRPLRRLYAAQLSVVLLSSLVGLTDPLIVKWLLDDVLSFRNLRMVGVAAIAFFLAQGTNTALISLGFLINAYASERLMLTLRLELLRHLQAQSPEYYLHQPVGDLLHRMEQDVLQIRELGGPAMASLLRIAVMTTLSVAILVLLNWKLTLITLTLVPMTILLRSLGLPHLRRFSDRAQSTAAARVAFLHDHFAALPQVQLLNRTAGERLRFVAVARKAIEAMIARQVAERSLTFGVNLATVAANALVLGLGGIQVLQGALTLGGLVAFQNYLSRVFGPTQSLANLYVSLQRAGASIRRVRAVLAVRPTIVDPPRPTHLPAGGARSVSLEGVRFSYPGQRPVLEALDLAVGAGEKVALVGGSGSGKSTIATLLVRMHDVEQGTIALDGVDVRELRLRDLRTEVVLVPQDPVIFDDTLRANLLCAAPDASDHTLRSVLLRVQLQEMLEELPQGLEEVLGPRGGRLSGGQRQRVAMARALLQEPRVLVLDEATSALDALTEHRLLRALDQSLAGRCTILVIAHRLPSIRWADRIAVLQDGRVRNEGRHEELYRRSDVYREICDRQLRQEPDAVEGPSGAAFSTAPAVGQ